MASAHDAVRSAARGERSDYRLDPSPISDGGGQAKVFGAIHKPSGLRVAFKKLRSGHPDALARMKREVRVATKLAECPHVMPVLDANLDEGWFVMPEANGNAEDFRDELLRDDELRTLVDAVAEALKAAHDEGWVHRDVKPANILWLEDSTGARWVLADWGLGRGPRGQTTQPGRTKVGASYGTEGFSAPELSIDAHAAVPATDIYSLGQMIGWAVTGEEPRPNVPLLPKGGPWRGVVKEATRHDPEDRPASVDDLLELVGDQLDEPPEAPATRGEQLLTDFQSGEIAALDRLLALAEHNPDDDDLYIDVLPQLKEDDVRDAVADSPARLREIAQNLRDWHGDWGDRSFKWADSVIFLLFRIARQAAQAEEWDLLEDATHAMCAWDGAWDQWTPQHPITGWLRSLSGDAARVVASVLRNHADSAVHFEELADERQVDGRLRSALRAPAREVG